MNITHIDFQSILFKTQRCGKANGCAELKQLRSGDRLGNVAQLTAALVGDTDSPCPCKPTFVPHACQLMPVLCHCISDSSEVPRLLCPEITTYIKAGDIEHPLCVQYREPRRRLSSAHPLASYPLGRAAHPTRELQKTLTSVKVTDPWFRLSRLISQREEMLCIKTIFFHFEKNFHIKKIPLK